MNRRAARAISCGLGEQLRSALWRLAHSRRVASPRRGFYVIVPPEHRAVGCPSPEWFIDDLMAYLGRPYYVGLLTAAALHGAAHQAPQEFQVVTDRRLPMIRIGRARIRFVKKARVATTPTVRVNTPTGQMRVSSPEATAIDLVRYPEHAGFLSNVATVLRELVERIDRRGLLRVATADGETAYAQRLGYLLDLHQADMPTEARGTLLRLVLPRSKIQFGPRGRWGTSGRLVQPWNVIENVPREALMETGQGPRRRIEFSRRNMEG